MFLLKKVFQLRDHVNPENEKPFLDHLEDLRVMVFKVFITLIISMAVCFIFQSKLLDLLKRPIEQVMKTSAAEQMSKPPIAITPERWDEAKAVGHACLLLDPAERDIFLKELGDPDLQLHARIAALQTATVALPEAKRTAFLNAVTTDQKIRDQVNFLIERKVSSDAKATKGTGMLSSLKPTETFMLSMKLAFFAGIILAFPLLLMFILQFIVPGLHENEKKMLWPALAIGFGLFLSGVAFAYFLVLPKALEFFYDYSTSMGVTNEWRIGDYISFATTFTLLFGLSFELPVIVMVIVKLGLLSYSTMAKTRSYAIVGVLVLAAILTPTPDVITLSLMAVPMYFLYEVCIWLAYFHEKKVKKQEDEEAKERMERLLRDYEEHEHIRTEHNDEHADHADSADDGWHAEETPEHDPYHGDPHHADPHTEHPPEISDLDDPAAGPPNSIPEEEERRRNDG